MDTTKEQPRLYNYTSGAVYCGLPPTYFKNQHKEGHGPTYIKPSPRRVYFTKDALDRWMATWKVVSPHD